MKVSTWSKVAWLYEHGDWMLGIFVTAFSSAMFVLAFGLALYMTSGDGPRACAASCGISNRSMSKFSREGNNVKCECGEAVK